MNPSKPNQALDIAETVDPRWKDLYQTDGGWRGIFHPDWPGTLAAGAACRQNGPPTIVRDYRVDRVAVGVRAWRNRAGDRTPPVVRQS